MIERITPLVNNKALVQISGAAKVIDTTGLDWPNPWTGLVSPELEQHLVQRFQITIPKRRSETDTMTPVQLLARARRKQLRDIANQITKARDRGFPNIDKLIPSKGLEIARQIPEMFLYLMWRIERLENEVRKLKAEPEVPLSTDLLKDNDTLTMRNWDTGHQEQHTVAEWRDEIVKVRKFRQLLRGIEQEWRQKVETIVADSNKTVAQRVIEVDQMEIEPFLGLEEMDTFLQVAQKLQALRQA